MSIVLQIGRNYHFQLLYSALGFVAGLAVTGYLIYPDRTKSDVVVFEDLGDGIYAGDFPYIRKTAELDEKYGVVIKENGVVKHFELIKMIN